MVYSQLHDIVHRFAKRNTLASDFQSDVMYMLTTMLDLKYNYRKIVRQLDKFANRHRGLYGPGTLHSISETVKRDLVAHYQIT